MSWMPLLSSNGLCQSNDPQLVWPGLIFSSSTTRLLKELGIGPFTPALWQQYTVSLSFLYWKRIFGTSGTVILSPN